MLLVGSLGLSAPQVESGHVLLPKVEVLEELLVDPVVPEGLVKLSFLFVFMKGRNFDFPGASAVLVSGFILIPPNMLGSLLSDPCNPEFPVCWGCIGGIPWDLRYEACWADI